MSCACMRCTAVPFNPREGGQSSSSLLSKTWYTSSEVSWLVRAGGKWITSFWQIQFALACTTIPGGQTYEQHLCACVHGPYPYTPLAANYSTCCVRSFPEIHHCGRQTRYLETKCVPIVRAHYPSSISCSASHGAREIYRAQRHYHTRCTQWSTPRARVHLSCSVSSIPTCGCWMLNTTYRLWPLAGSTMATGSTEKRASACTYLRSLDESQVAQDPGLDSFIVGDAQRHCHVQYLTQSRVRGGGRWHAENAAMEIAEKYAEWAGVC